VAKHCGWLNPQTQCLPALDILHILNSRLCSVVKHFLLSRCLHAAQQERVIPAAKVATDDEEEDEGCSLANGGESKLRDTSDEDLTEGISPDSSFHSCFSHTSSGTGPRPLGKG